MHDSSDNWLTACAASLHIPADTCPNPLRSSVPGLSSASYASQKQRRPARYNLHGCGYQHLPGRGSQCRFPADTALYAAAACTGYYPSAEYKCVCASLSLKYRYRGRRTCMPAPKLKTPVHCLYAVWYGICGPAGTDNDPAYVYPHVPPKTYTVPVFCPAGLPAHR